MSLNIPSLTETNYVYNLAVMLVETQQRSQMIQRFAGDPARGFCFRHFAWRGESGDGPCLLVDDPANPQVLFALDGGMVMVKGAYPLLQAAWADLLELRVQSESWPGEQLEQEWSREGRRGLFLGSCSYHAWRAAVLAGVEADPGDAKGQVAYQWFTTGPARFSELVKHSCRLGEGEELVELLKQGVPYDPEGEYIRLCVQHGPSFVCEVDGQPVCWSCTHLNRTMGMIYTPEEHRRQGYARSLAAFQIDHMLKLDGIACCHVIDFNVPSMSMVAGLGFQRLEEPVVWRVVRWPEAAPASPPGEGS
jgi:hypothetical protein